jgi:multisubunit Na+/H+ antiporter MnhG subunit
MGQRSSRWLWVGAALVVLALAVVGWAVAPATTMIVGVVLAALAVPVGIVLVATAALSRR